VKKPGRIDGISLAVFLLLTAMQVRSETKPANVWASVQFSKNSVVVGEPLLVTVTVYTSTWFTSPPEFNEIQVAEAMMVNYEQRTGSMRKRIGNKTYPAIEKKYVVYPFREGENLFPELTIVTESPPEGDYKGRRMVIKSAERKFTVKQPPAGVSRERWLTAFDVRVTEIWNQPLSNLKQGDVLERRIAIRAAGAVAALIPPLDLPEIAFGNIYSKPHVLNNQQNETSFTGTRTETWTYLLESEGVFTIPEVLVSWFDPRSDQLEYSGIPEQEIEIAENPNLGFLLSMQDSLRMLLEEGSTAETEPFGFMGLKWWELLIAVASGIVVIYLTIRFVTYTLVALEIKRKSKADSEQSSFELLQEAAFKEDPMAFMRQLIFWYDRFRKGTYLPLFRDLLTASEEEDLTTQYERLERIIFSNDLEGQWSGKAMYESLRRLRKKILAVRNRKDRTTWSANVLNP
jgi:cbb3-type cytochrome oxidase subunit 3